MKRGPKKASEIQTSNLCEHGCGTIAKYITHSGKLICKQHSSSCPVVRAKNKNALENKHEELRKTNGKAGFYNYNDLPEETKNSMNWNKDKFTGTIFEQNGGGNHKKFLINERGHCCENCGLEMWFGKPITLELDHIDGDNKNNTKDNLKLLCPNCHSYTDTWRGRNISNSTKNKVSDEVFLEALKGTSTIRQALIRLGLTPKGGNYERAHRLISANFIKNILL